MLFKKILALSVVLFLVFLVAGAGIAKEVSQYRARTVAQNWLHHLSVSRDFANSSLIPAGFKIVDEEVMVYNNRVVGYNFILSPKGHIIVPFRDELPPVKLYSDTATLRMADDSDVAEWIREELFKVYEAMDAHGQELEGVDFSTTPNGKLWALFDVDSSFFPSEYTAVTSGTESLSIGPLLTTTWDQGDPYNQYCPTWAAAPYAGQRTVTGCVATAAAQIMKFWNYPASGQGSHSYTWNNGSTNQTLSANFGATTYQWGLMRNTYSSGNTAAEKDAVARLMSDIGIAFEMDYGVSPLGGSAASTMYGTTVFPTYFKYKNTVSAAYRSSYASDSAWMQVFRNEVQNGRPSQLRIRDPNAGGHSVVVDGYRDSPSEQIHINFGWSGSYNGWYASNNMVTGGYNWSDVNYQGAVIGIEPAVTPPPPATGAYTMNPNASYSYVYASTPIISWTGGTDDGYYDLSLAGFNFKFYGTSVTSARVSTNGYITFGTDGSNWSNDPIPTAALPNAIVAPFWTDLVLSSGAVYWSITGVAPNRQVIIEWRNVPSLDFGTETYSFEIILYESSNKIKLQYLDVDSGTAYDFGALATVGIENADGTAGVQFSYNTASLTNNKAIEFTPKRSGNVDFDGDGKADIAIYRPSAGIWFISPSGGSPYGIAWGVSTDKPVPGDYDGDGKTDAAIYRDGLWFVSPSGGGSPYGVGWGLSTDTPVPGDYDGDGKADVAIFRPSAGVWFISPSGGSPYGVGWGLSTDKPVPGDYDGDGKTDVAIFRPSAGVWFISPSGGSPYGVGWGLSTDKPVPGDYDGDGKADVAIFRPSAGIWFISPSGGSPYGVGWGSPDDKPVQGDYDGDGKADVAIFRPSAGVWFMSPSGGGSPYGVGWGISTDIPITTNIVD